MHIDTDRNEIFFLKTRGYAMGVVLTAPYRPRRLKQQANKKSLSTADNGGVKIRRTSKWHT